MNLFLLIAQAVPATGTDPNLFHIDWDRTFEVLSAIAIVAIMVERGLSLVFENRLFVARLKGSGLKELIAFGVSAYVCWQWHFDALSTILLTDHTSHLGELITAAVVAGGSKGSVKLFRDFLGVRSNAYTQLNGPPPHQARPVHPHVSPAPSTATASVSVQTPVP